MSSTTSPAMSYPHQQLQQQHNATLSQPAMTGPSMMDSSLSYQYGNLFPLRSQVEFYFSPQNLAKDTYLLAQLNTPEHRGAVPMSVICSFPKVRQIYALLNNMGHWPLHLIPMADPVLVRMAVYQSTVVSVSQDGAFISPMDTSWMKPQQQPPPPVSAGESINRSESSTSEEPSRTEPSAPSSPSSQATATSSLGVPTHPLPPPVPLSSNAAKETSASSSTSNRGPRNVVIVRDVPSTATFQEVMGVFQTEHFAPLTARPDVGNTWFVTFETEEQAVKALTQSHDAEIAGVPVRGHLKSDIRPQQLQKQTNTSSRSTSDSVTSAGSVASIGAGSSSGNVTVNSGMPPLQQAMPMTGGHAAYPVILPAAGYAMPMHQPQQQYGQYPQMPYGYVTYGMPPQGPMRVQPPYHYRPGGNQSYYNNNQRHMGRNYTAQGGKPPPHVYLQHGRQQQQQYQRQRQQSFEARNAPNASTSIDKNSVSSRESRESNSQMNSTNSKKNYTTTDNSGKSEKKWQPSSAKTPEPSLDQKQQQAPPKSEANPQAKSSSEQKQQQQPKNGGEKKATKKKRQTSKRNNNKTKEGLDKNKTKEVLDLGAENFPALGGGPVPTSPEAKKLPTTTTGGYAQALLKKPETVSSALSSTAASPTTVPAVPVEATPATLDAAMSKLAFSEEAASTKAAYDEW